jgi:pimeloyl-ACP methyl ester carboxylesterase
MFQQERRRAFLAIFFATVAIPAQPRAQESELQRRAMFGAQLAEVTAQLREQLKIPGGVALTQVFDGTSAADAKFRSGDILVSVDGTRLTGIPAFLAIIAKTRAGDVSTMEVLRDGVRRQLRVSFREMPRERGDGYNVIYGSVTSHGARLRTIVTRPNEAAKHPAILLLQGGHTCFAIDTPVGEPVPFTLIASDLTRHGYVTMRVERPGCGDSEGGPLRDIGFDRELDGYKKALQALQQLPFVDSENVFLFGHSMGGMVAPLIAIEFPTRGIAVYGSGAATWFEAVFAQRRRLATLSGTPTSEVDREILDQGRFWSALLLDRRTPREILARNPQLQRLGWVVDENYVSERHFTFHHEVADKNFSEAWAKVAATRLPNGTQPRILTMWGSADWLVDRASSEWIAEVVNRSASGSARFAVLDSIDHGFFRTSSAKESYLIWSAAANARTREFNMVLLDTLRAWMRETMSKVPVREPNPNPSDKLGRLFQ